MARAKGIGSKFIIGENKQPGLSNETRPKKQMFTSVTNVTHSKKIIFVPPPGQLKIFPPEPSCKTRPTRRAKSKGIGELSKVRKIQNEKKKEK